jgi:hypothetical protein
MTVTRSIEDIMIQTPNGAKFARVEVTVTVTDGFEALPVGGARVVADGATQAAQTAVESVARLVAVHGNLGPMVTA